MAIKRMLENKIHLLNVSYVSTYIFRSDHLESEVTTKLQFNNNHLHIEDAN